MLTIVDEKQVKMVAKSPGSQSDGENPDIDWSPEEERQLVRK